MRYSEAQRLEYRIGKLFEEAGNFEDLEILAELAKYICVLTSGFIEASCRQMVAAYAAPRCDTSVLSFVNSQLKHFQNPKTEKILEVIGCFDSDKRREIEEEMDTSLKDAVNSVVGLRHQIVHGRDVSLSITVIKDYFERSSKLIRDIETDLCA